MEIFELCTHYESLPWKEKGMPEGGYGIHITAELKGPDKRCQVQKEGLQIIVLMTDT